MKIFRLSVQIKQIRSFSESLVLCIMQAGAIALLLRMSWGRPGLRLWGIASCLAIVALVATQARIVWGAYREARPQIEKSNDPVLRRTMNTMLQTFNFANALSLIVVALIEIMMHAIRH